MVNGEVLQEPIPSGPAVEAAILEERENLVTSISEIWVETRTINFKKMSYCKTVRQAERLNVTPVDWVFRVQQLCANVGPTRPAADMRTDRSARRLCDALFSRLYIPSPQRTPA